MVLPCRPVVLSSHPLACAVVVDRSHASLVLRTAVCPDRNLAVRRTLLLRLDLRSLAEVVRLVYRMGCVPGEGARQRRLVEELHD